MQKNNWVLGLVVFLVIVGFGIWGFSKSKPGSVKSVAGVSEPDVSNVAVDTSKFFDENATIMFFYSDGCGWCTKEKAVLSTLAVDGYKVKPMDVGKNPDLWKTYNVKGTPTFIAANGQRQEGYMEKDALKAWLDANK